MRRLAILLVSVTLASCGSSDEPPSSQPPPGGGGISGTEKLEWDQPAADAAELAAFRYILYIDGAGSELTNVTCASTAGPAGFTCSVRLPAMTPGSHALQLTAFIDVGGRLESDKSTPLSIVVAGGTLGAPWSGVASLTTVDGVRLRASTVTDGLDEPTDLAFAPDGRIFIAEREGRIRVVKNRLEPASTIVLADVLAAAPNGLMAIALDPRFDHNGFIYAAYTAASGFRIARFRSAGDTLEDGTILMDGIEFSAGRPAASLRFGPDAKLYVAFDDGTDPGGAGDAGGFNGKVLRLNPDATTPDDQPDGTPVYTSQISSPRGLDWDSLGTLWIADQTANGQDGLQAVTQQSAHDLGGVAAARYALPDGTGVTGIAVYDGDVIEAFRGDLLVAAGDGRAVMRFRFDAVNPLAIASTERLLGDIVGRIRAVGVAPWGTVYLCTDSAVVQLLPDASADRPRARRALSDRR